MNPRRFHRFIGSFFFWDEANDVCTDSSFSFSGICSAWRCLSGGVSHLTVCTIQGGTGRRQFCLSLSSFGFEAHANRQFRTLRFLSDRLTHVFVGSFGQCDVGDDELILMKLHTMQCETGHAANVRPLGRDVRVSTCAQPVFCV